MIEHVLAYRLPAYPLTRLPACPLTRLPAYPLTRLPAYPLTRLPAYPLTRLPAPYTRPLHSTVRAPRQVDRSEMYSAMSAPSGYPSP